MLVVGSKMYRSAGITAMRFREAALSVKWGDISHVRVHWSILLHRLDMKQINLDGCRIIIKGLQLPGHCLQI